TGITSSPHEPGLPNFPTTPNALQPNLGGPSDGAPNAFVTKINPNGSALVFSTYLGGSGGDAGSGIAVDTAGNVYVTGDTGSTDFPTVMTLSIASHVKADSFCWQFPPSCLQVIVFNGVLC